MITNVSSQEELKDVFVEILINSTDKVTKVAPHSIVDGVANAVGAIGQKALKDIALLETHLFPQHAYGQHLDQIAANNGIPSRFGPSGSSCYIRLVADPDTLYDANEVIFTGNHGIEFTLATSVTISSFGYSYAIVNSTNQGDFTNVDPLTINQVLNGPPEHIYVINEGAAIGGRDTESDFLFRQRIQNYTNLISTDTLQRIAIICRRTNQNVYKVFYGGINSIGIPTLLIMTHNGVQLNPTALNQLYLDIEPFLSFTDISSFDSTYQSIELKNLENYPIDVQFRLQTNAEFNIDDIRINIQRNISNYLKIGTWNPGETIHWDDILQLVKEVDGVEVVSDSDFFPREDIFVPYQRVPRLRGFLMRNLNNEIIVDFQNRLNPIFYPLYNDYIYQNNLSQ